MKRLTPFLFALFVLPACDPSSDSDTAADGDRGPIGKADLMGSCEGVCGGMALSGNCWCDDACADFGDCCDDRAAICGDPDAQMCGGFAGLQCPDGETCVDDPDDDCDPENGGADCGGICVEDEEPGTFCGGFGNLPCPDGQTCVDDPDDDCDPENGGADCGGICVEDEEPGTFCGGFGNLPCPDGQVCVDDPTDDCDPDNNNFDCGGICEDVPADAPSCGGFAGLQCPDGLTCVDDPSDSCDASNGADCIGICV